MTENLEITKKENKLITFSIIFGKRVLLLMQIDVQNEFFPRTFNDMTLIRLNFYIKLEKQ